MLGRWRKTWKERRVLVLGLVSGAGSDDTMVSSPGNNNAQGDDIAPSELLLLLTLGTVTALLDESSLLFVALLSRRLWLLSFKKLKPKLSGVATYSSC